MHRKFSRAISLLLVSCLLAGCGNVKTPTLPLEDNHRVFYEIFVGSFSDSDGDKTGDLRGIINRLDYLNDGNPDSETSLGIEGIWLSPIFSSPSYHKYDVKDYYEIDESFGTMDDLKELVTLCHERGIKVILDLVLNHTSSQNESFKEFTRAHQSGDKSNPFYDYYSYTTPGNTKGKTFSKITSSDDFYECNFSTDMPELNYDNETVRNDMLDVAKYYLNEIGVDGFRFDAAKYIYFGETAPNVEFWDWYVGELKKIKPDVYTVAEVWDSDSVTDAYMPVVNCFNFSMSQQEGIIALAAKKGDVNRYVSYVESYVNNIKAMNESAMIIPFIANHDTDRAAGYVQVSYKTAQMAANLYLLGPGSPFIYYGEEIGMKGSRGGANTDANRRLAMLWGDDDTVGNPIGSTYEDKNQTNGTVAEQLTNPDSLFNYYKRVIRIRKNNPEIFEGDYTAVNFEDSKAAGFVAATEDSYVGVFHNTQDEAVTLDLSVIEDYTFKKIADSIGTGSEAATINGSELTIPAQTSAILR